MATPRELYEEAKKRGLLDQIDPKVLQTLRARFDPVDVNQGVEDESAAKVIAEEAGRGVLGFAHGAGELLNLPAIPGGLERLGRIGVGLVAAPFTRPKGEEVLDTVARVASEADEESFLPAPFLDETIAGTKAILTRPFADKSLPELYEENVRVQKQYSEKLPVNTQALGLTASVVAPAVNPLAKAVAKRIPGAKALLTETIGDFVKRRGGEVSDDVAKAAAKEGFPVDGTVDDLKQALVENKAVEEAGQAGIVRQREKVAELLEEKLGVASKPVEQPKVMTGAEPQVQEVATAIKAESGTGVGPIEQTKIPEPVNLGGAPTLDKVANVNLENFKSPEQVKGFFQQVIETNKHVFQAARRGKMSSEEIFEHAQAMGIDIDDIKARNIGETYTAEQIEVGKRIVQKRTQDTYSFAQNLDPSSPKDRLRWLQRITEDVAVTANFYGGTSEVGRALNAAKQLNALDKTKAKLGKQFLEVFKGLDNEKELGKAMQMFKAIDPDDIPEMQRFIGGLQKAEWKDKIYELWLNGILSGLLTHMRNLAGNTITFLTKPAEQVAAGVIDAGLAKIQGRPRERFVGEAFHGVYGFSQGLKQGVRGFLKTIATEVSPFGDQKYIGKPRIPAIKGVKGRVIRLPTTLLSASDALYKSLNMQTSLHSFAYRAAKQAGLKGEALNTRIAELVSNPTKAMLSDAHAEAAYRTFTQQLSSTERRFLAFRQAPGGKYVQPFGTTPINITKYGLERTPLNFLRIGAKQSRLFGLRPLESGELADALSRSILGTATAAGGAFGAYKTFKGQAFPERPASQISEDKDLLHIMGTLTAGGVAQLWAEGKITGAVPMDPDEAKVFYASGKLPYAVKIGDKWTQYNLEPFGVSIGLTADVMNLIDKVGLEEEDAAWVLGAAMATNFLNKSITQGLSNFVNGISDPERYGEKLITQLAGSFVPFSSLGRSVARAIDPTLRIPHGIKEGVMAQIPFLNQKIPPLYDIWGEPVVFEGNFATRLLSPIRTSTAKKDPETVEVDRLNVKPGSIRRKIGNIGIADPVYQQAVQIRGRMARERIKRVIASDNYKEMPDTLKAERLRQQFEEAGEHARKVLGITQAKKRLFQAERNLSIAKDTGKDVEAAQKAYDEARSSEVFKQ